MKFSGTTPVIRVLNEAEAKKFYVEFLGFNVDWEHRFEPGFPLYFQVSRGECILHLSEHTGDCRAGCAMRIKCSQVEDYFRELSERNPDYKLKLERPPWKTVEFDVKDPFGNRITFCSEIFTS